MFALSVRKGSNEDLFLLCKRSVKGSEEERLGGHLHFHWLLCSFSVSFNSIPILPLTVMFKTLMEGI